MSDSLRDVIYDAMGRPGDWEKGVIQPSQFELDNHSHWRAIAGDVARAITEAGWRPPLPDSETEWGTESPDGDLRVAEGADEARWIVTKAEPTWRLKRREVGPWIEVQP